MSAGACCLGERPLSTGDLIKLALLFAERTGGRDGQQAAAHVARVAVATASCVCCGVAAMACALVALWLYVLPQVGPTGAPLVVAGVLLAMCLALVALLRYGLKPRPAPASGVAPSVLIAETARLVNENKAAALLAALLAGLVAGRRDK